MFFEENKEKFPGVSLSQMNEVIEAPWKFLKKNMSSDELPAVRFIHFGEFKVRGKNLDKMIEKKRKNMEKGFMTKKDFSHFVEVIRNFEEKREAEKRP